MTEFELHRASTTAPVNIAVIKYWGKRDATLNLPTNSSLSVTLSQSDLRTHTTAACSPTFPRSDTLTLNGAPQPLTTPRSIACLHALRALRTELEAADPALPKLARQPLRIVSTNNFPTAAGLASSAAGFAALVRAIADLYALPQSPEELSLIARQGSGSACRSLLGGFVGWQRGEAADGSDSRAYQVAEAAHWPGLHALILVASAAKKGVSSTSGMQATVATSPLFQTRWKEVVPARMTEMEGAIKERDFSAFARVTMRESNNFHATCLDTEPPILYLNDTSRAAMRAVEGLNERAGKIVAAYTFDAGPNAVVYYQAEDEELVAGSFKYILGGAKGWDGKRGRAVKGEGLRSAIDEVSAKSLKDGVNRVILTGVGAGPMKTEEHLVDEKGEEVVVNESK
ncbi:MAG: diphosphomevalonate decarboxylase [Bathelium mastoideum]|nr:MAG: diphosphomevalonate decarboxylase [Bathelium mastoideum]